MSEVRKTIKYIVKKIGEEKFIRRHVFNGHSKFTLTSNREECEYFKNLEEIFPSALPKYISQVKEPLSLDMFEIIEVEIQEKPVKTISGLPTEFSFNYNNFYQRVDFTDTASAYQSIEIALTNYYFCKKPKSFTYSVENTSEDEYHYHITVKDIKW